MKYRPRTFYTDKQKSEMWDRWQRGESLSSIGRRFNRASSSIFPHLALTGGMRPAERIRSHLALSLEDREEISRGLATGASLRSIARDPNAPHQPSVAKFIETADAKPIAPHLLIGGPGTAQDGPKHVSSPSTRACAGSLPGSCD